MKPADFEAVVGPSRGRLRELLTDAIGGQTPTSLAAAIDDAARTRARYDAATRRRHANVLATFGPNRREIAEDLTSNPQWTDINPPTPARISGPPTSGSIRPGTPRAAATTSEADSSRRSW